MPREAGPSCSHPSWIDPQLTRGSPPDIQLWTNVRSPGFTTGERLSEVQSLLNSPSKVTLARSLQRCEAQRLVDSLDRVSQRCLPSLPRELIQYNTGPCAVAPRRRILAARSAPRSQGLQNAEDRTLIVYTPRGVHTRRGGSLREGFHSRELWKIPGSHRGYQMSQDERGKL